MDINYLTELINKYESSLTGEFTIVHVKIFSDGSGTLAMCNFSNEYEELLEFDNIDELYKFLVPKHNRDECTVKKCCLICDHVVIDNRYEADCPIPCHCWEHMKHGGTLCMKQDDVCEHFVLNTILVPE